MKYKSVLILITFIILLTGTHLGASNAYALCLLRCPPGTIPIITGLSDFTSRGGNSNNTSSGGAPAPAAPAAVAPASQPPADFSLNVYRGNCEITGFKVPLEWTPSDRAETYEIHRKKFGDRASIGTPATLIFTQNASDTKYTDSLDNSNTPIKGGEYYEYLIKAVNSQGSNSSDSFASQNFVTQDCNPKAKSAQLVEGEKQKRLANIRQNCTYLGKVNDLCIQTATSDCLSDTKDETEKDICIANYKPVVPSEFRLKGPTLICDAQGNGIKLTWDNPTNRDYFDIERKINDEPFKYRDNTRATTVIDRNLPDNLLSATYRIKAIGPEGADFARFSNEMSFPPSGSNSDELLSKLLNCRKGGPGFTTTPPKLPRSTEPVPSFIRDLTIQRVGSGDQTDPNAGYGQNADTFAPNESARFGARLYNSNLEDDNGCPVVGATFKFIKVNNDDGTTAEVRSVENRPVCQPHLFKLDLEPGNYRFQVEFAGEEGLGKAAGPQWLPFSITKEADVPTKMKAYINGKNYTTLFQDSPEFTGMVNIGAKLFVSSKDEDCIIKPVNLKFERVADQNFKPLTGGPENIVSSTSNSPAANCQSYTVPTKSGSLADTQYATLTEPGVYKLTASFIQGAKGTGLKPVLESTATMLLKKTGFDEATIDADIGGALISKAKSKGAVAGIAVQKIGDQLVLKQDPAVLSNTIPVRACVRPKNNPNNIEAISGVRIMVEKFDLQGNPLGQAFNEIFPNDCQQKDINLGDTQNTGCYNVNILEEDEDFTARPVSKRLCFTDNPVKSKPYTNITIDPAPGAISSVDDPTVTVTTNEFSDSAHFAVLNEGKPYAVSPASSQAVSNACSTGFGDCVYQLQLYKPNGSFEVKFCHDNQNNCSDPLTFSTNPTPVETDPDKIIGVGLEVDGTEIPLPFDGQSIGLDLAPNSKQDQVFRLIIHRADKSRDSYTSLTFIYDEELGQTVPADNPTPAPVEEGGGGQATQQACIPGEFNNQCTGACGGCAENAGELKVMQCRTDGSGFDEQGGECSTDCAGPCQTVPANQCPDESFFPEPENGGTGCTKKYYTAFPQCQEQFDVEAPMDSPGCS